jgi:lysophospholipid acyltransferase (LPLAT)-like uncharacterized protein
VDFRMKCITIAGSSFIRCLGHTWRIQMDATDTLRNARQLSPNVVFALWHGRLLPLLFAHRNRSIYTLASEHRDGELMGQTARRFGFGHVRGSSTRGGTRAILGLVEKLEQGYDVGITVDGPRGPRYRVKPGMVQIAKMSGVPIVPVTAGSRHHKTFGTWDAFELPYPFTRVRVAYGEPLIVPADADDDELEEKRLELETVLKSLTETNDDAVRR